ncbi:MAG: ATP-binding protein [Roseiflexaceae bacterium]
MAFAVNEARRPAIAAMNLCPCGHWQNPEKTCTCSAAVFARYQKRISVSKVAISSCARAAVMTERDTRALETMRA